MITNENFWIIILIIICITIILIYWYIKNIVTPKHKQSIMRNKYSSYLHRKDTTYRNTKSYNECIKLLKADMLCIPNTIADDGLHITINDTGLYRLLNDKYPEENQYFDDIVKEIYYQYNQLHTCEF